MMKNQVSAWALGTLLLVTWGCKQPHPGWEPPLEETSTRFLQVQVEEALAAVHRAQEDVESNPAQTERQLADAERALERMSRFYLPLLEARERTYDAHRYLYYGELHRSKAELEAVEKILDTVAQSGGVDLQPVLKEPLDLVSEAKAAVIAGTDNAPELVSSLAIRLNLMALRGGLDLPTEWPKNSQKTNG